MTFEVKKGFRKNIYFLYFHFTTSLFLVWPYIIFSLSYNFNLSLHRQCWLDHEKSITSHLPPTSLSFEFVVKFYTPDPGMLEEEYTRLVEWWLVAGVEWVEWGRLVKSTLGWLVDPDWRGGVDILCCLRSCRQVFHAEVLEIQEYTMWVGGEMWAGAFE